MNAKQCVYKVIKGLLPSTTITDKTKLADIGYDDTISKDILRAAINTEKWHDVKLPRGALDGCSAIEDITKVLETADGQ